MVNWEIPAVKAGMLSFMVCVPALRACIPDTRLCPPSDVKELLSKLEAVADAGKEYQTFTKVAEGTKGSVKFILRTEAVKEEEN